MKLRLFALRDLRTNQILPHTFFADKKQAKNRRDELNVDGAQLYCVTYGPDHRHFRA